MAERILVIDDEAANLRLYRAILEKYFEGAEVRAEDGGVRGLAAVKEFRPDIVLLDARMPDLDGFEVCRQIKTDPSTAGVPVLMVSGAYIQSHHRISGFEGGADGYVCKPFKAQDLAAQMKTLLSGAAARTQLFRVMLVDASRTSRQIVMSEVKRNPYVEVAAFENGDAALAALDVVRPDLAICDGDMPGLDGFEVAARLRAVPAYAAMPVIILSRRANERSAAERAKQAGVAELLPKPFAPSELLAVVNRLVAVSRESMDRVVLVADEREDVRARVSEHLEGLHLRICEARNVAEATHAVEMRRPVLVIVGARLGAQTGVGWCVELRGRQEYKWIPILALANGEVPAVDFIRAGADDYLSGELVGEEIRLRVANLLKRVSLTDELTMALQRERALNEHKNRVLGIAAHDIRSPVTVISHFAELLLASPMEDPGHVRSRVSAIRDTAKHALDIVNSLLDVKSIQSGLVEFQSKPFRLDELLAERIAFMNEIGQARRIKGTLARRGKSDDPAWVRGDRHRLAQVVDNIMGNAVKYCPDGSAYTVSLTREVEGWLVEVEDNGPGIPRDELFGVFDEFGRTSVRPTGGEKSTGLGLAIVKKLVELHGGTVWIDSKVGQGTKLSFVLPAHGPADEAEKERS